MSKIIETDRLVLRTWQSSDLEPLAAIHNDTRVMQYLGATRDINSSQQYIEKLDAHYIERGYTSYAVDVKDTNQFIGCIGLRFADYLPDLITPSVEIVWRLAFKYWGQGYATEGATAVLHYGFNTLRLDQVISLASSGNLRSRRIMEKIGLIHKPADDFDHPRYAEGDPLKRHVIYRLTKNEYIDCKK